MTTKPSQKVIILHGSITGTSLDLSSRLSLSLHRLGYQPSISSLSLFNPTQILDTIDDQVPIVFFLPTTGNGTAPPSFLPLWNALLHPQLPRDFLQGFKYACFGLGDSSYPKYNWCAKKFDKRVGGKDGLGAERIGELGLGDDQNEFGVESTFPKWRKDLLRSIKQLYPLSNSTTSRDDQDEDQDEALPPPAVKLFDLPTSQASSSAPSSQPLNDTKNHTDRNSLDSQGGVAGEVNGLKWTQDCKMAKLVKNERVTSQEWWQDVREIELEILSDDDQEDEFSYTPGDVLELRPSNSPVEVQRLVETLGWEDEVDIVREWRARDEQANPLPPHFPRPYITSLRNLLLHELDVSSVPKVGIFEWLSAFTKSDMGIRYDGDRSSGDDGEKGDTMNRGKKDEQQEETKKVEEDPNEIGEKDMRDKLKEFSTPEGQDDLNDYAIRPRRTLVEILTEFKRVVHKKIPIEYALDWIPMMRSRGFSIASSPTVHSNKRIQLLVAIVRYKTNLSVERRGVATTWIEGLQVGAHFPIRIDRTGQLRLPPPSPSKTPGKEATASPLIMVGPGTGAAPFRALVEERVGQGIKDNLLFFGCRSLSHDAHYHDYFSNLQDEGSLKYVVAASRDQEEKIYVQHRISEHGRLVANWLSDERGGYLYICGSSTAMPRAVKKSILTIFQNYFEGIESEGQAEKKWDELEKQGRIREEVWG